MLTVRGVVKSYRAGGFFSGKRHNVVQDVSFECGTGECLGILGESGSGKSTLGRLILGLEKPDRGEVSFEGTNVLDRRVRSGNLSAVFQDYKSSINPFFTVEDAIMEPLLAQGGAKTDYRDRVDLLLNQVGLDMTYKNKYPHELSGGEAQRVCIARAVSTGPKCILLDEAVSSLDVSVQIQVLQMLKELKEIYRMSYIFITHDIQAAAYLCDRILIFKSGRVEETVHTVHLKHMQSDYAKELIEHLMTF